MSKRARSDSAIEEASITEYVESCVNYKTNVTIIDAAKPHTYAENVLILGTKDQIAEHANGLLKALPIHNADVTEAALRMTEDNKTLSLFTKADGVYRKLTLFAIPSKATRNNCPYRSDAVCEAVSAACASVEVKASADSDAKKAKTVGVVAVEKVLDIVVLTPEGSEAAVCNAIASGSPNSFSTKSGAAAPGAAFMNKATVAIRVIFAASNAALHGDKVPGYSVADLEALMTHVQLCQRLIDTPPNYLDTIVFAEIAERCAKKMGCAVKTIKGAQLQEQGYGGIYAVGRGAEYPPHLVTLYYDNKAAAAAAAASGEAPKNVAFVGKGLVYDCGGLALKPAVHMCNMKTDMGGAAAVFSGFLTIVAALRHNKNAAKAYNAKNVQHLSVTLCLAENAIGPKAYRNDDIIGMKSGKSVEVNNTDAEGRICLGDGVHFATDETANFFKATHLVDMATLTGAQGIATGTHHAAIYANDADAEQKILAAGRASGNTCFPVLYCPEYHQPQFKSNCADMHNLMATGTDGGVSCAGYFVEANTVKDYAGKMIHVDLAFPSFNSRGSTGYGVALLTQYLQCI